MNHKETHRLTNHLQTGRLLATPGVLAAVPGHELMAAFTRHLHCDWGEISPQDWRTNDYALRHGERIISAYSAADQTKFWIITEADRSATTLLLPEEY